jgi:ABC-type transporter Mla subunit MlaD
MNDPNTFLLIFIAATCLVNTYLLSTRKRGGGNHEELQLIIHKLNTMAKTQAQTAQEIRDIKAQNEKARVEILAKIQALEDALATAGNTSDEVDAAVQDLKASVQADDDLNPDAPTP